VVGDAAIIAAIIIVEIIGVGRSIISAIIFR
jgi:hypothetical protein